MIKINIIGSIFGSSGYDSHTRSLANSLYKIADCQLSTQLPPDWMKQVNDAELDMITKQERKNDYNLIISMPNMWKMFTGLGKNIGYCVWEGDKVPKSWIKEFSNPKINLIFVPSEHTKQAIENTLKNICKDFEFTHEYLMIMNKVKIIPHGVDRSIFHSQRKKDNDDAQDVSLSGDTNHEQGKTNKVEQVPVSADNHVDGCQESPNVASGAANGVTVDNTSKTHPDTFKFICNKGWRGTNWDRGGVQYVIKAFAEEFSKDEKVQLIIKLNLAYINPNDIEKAISALNLPEDRAPIHINCEMMPFNKLPELYNQADCYVCATRAESFNLPGLEAMGCGLPTIQTKYGGQTDYMTTGNSLWVDYKLEEVKEDLMYQGIKWATPDIKCLQEQMRWAFNNQNKIKEMGKQAEEDSKNWTWYKTADIIAELLK